MNLDDELAFAHELADLADARTMAAFRQDLDVEHKSDGTPVTMVDREVEQSLRAAILVRHAGHQVLGEEDGVSGGSAGPQWLVDPIDGTKNFVRGIPAFATLIALMLDGEPVVAVVSAPALQTRWDGLIDGERRVANRNGNPVRVSDRTLGDGQVVFGGLDWFHRKGRQAAIDRLTVASARQRGFGDFWNHCLVAEGAVEVAVEAEVSPWDLAAVACVVRAAGGRFTDLDGNETIAGGSAISSNGVVHDEVVAAAQV